MSWGKVVVTSLPATPTLVDLMQRQVNVDQGIDDARLMNRWHEKVSVRIREMTIGGEVEIERIGKLRSHLEEGLVKPIPQSRTQRLNKAGDVAALDTRPFLGGFMVKTMWRFLATC